MNQMMDRIRDRIHNAHELHLQLRENPDAVDVLPAVLAWAREARDVLPKVDMLIPTGEGARALGVPALFLAVANHGHHGLFVELHEKGGKLRIEQVAFQVRLRILNYRVELCGDFVSAQEAIVDYLQGV